MTTVPRDWLRCRAGIGFAIDTAAKRTAAVGVTVAVLEADGPVRKWRTDGCGGRALRPDGVLCNAECCQRAMMMVAIGACRLRAVAMGRLVADRADRADSPWRWSCALRVRRGG